MQDASGHFSGRPGEPARPEPAEPSALFEISLSGAQGLRPALVRTGVVRVIVTILLIAAHWALHSADFPGRVLMAASGRLSHWLPSNDPSR
jgi:hypothetical protein